MKFAQAALVLLAAAAAPSLHAQSTYCTLPGEPVSEDEAGDAYIPSLLAEPPPVPNPGPGYDALAVYVAEPAGADKVHVTLEVDAISPVPNTVYFVRFNTSDGVERFFAYNPMPFPASPAGAADPMFYYGHIEVEAATSSIVTDGPTDAESAVAGNRITWVLSRDRLDGFARGEFIDGVYGEPNFVTGPFGIGFYFPTDDTPTGSYAFRGTCGGGKSGGLIGAGSLPLSLLALAGIAAGLRRRAALSGRATRALAAAAAALVAQGAQAQAHCTLPGELISEDPTGDAVLVAAPDPVPGHDVSTLHVAEDGAGLIYFTMKVDRLEQAATPQSRYIVNFTGSDGVGRFVRYTPYPLGPAAAVFTGADQMWSYGHYEVNPTTGGTTSVTDGPAHEASTAAADGTITIALAKSVLSESGPGELLDGITADARIYNVSGTVVVDESDAAGAYELRGCGGSKSAGLIGAGAVAPLLLALFGFLGWIRRIA